ncbi:hypothetical protein PMZ80_001716 [Knufia obscura]|uniref:C2H2-type domain-containing protein n=1 Tax=Knufia obscura TaxID=1635080 RepID=A0ABR0S3Y4_9EURO|nr:hypothetical protein PMZ80_001716 [Knufia obscura]
MSPTTPVTSPHPTSHNLLTYNPHHNVLICLSCQYAIQKSAIQSHLLRHKIYRGDRQRLLSSIATLDLLEPEDVPLPEKGSKPIDGLPVIKGYACKVDGCGSLCASVKRMRRHWGEVHAAGPGEGVDGGFEGCARKVELQTFFRGTKLRYFEVRSSEAGDREGAGVLDTTHDMDGHGDDDNVDDEQHQDADLAPQPPPPPLPCTRSPPRSSPVDFDLETLTYFHHFTTTTSLMLPGPEYPRPAAHYWQIDAVHLALQRRTLMCGLLAISAYHLAVLAEETTTSQVHHERSVQFCSEFFAGWEEATERKSAVGVRVAGVEKEANTAGRQIMCILRCASWALDNTALIQKPAGTSPLQSFMTIVRGFVDSDFDFNHNGVGSDISDGRAGTSAQAGRILETKGSSDPDARSFGPWSPSINSDNTPTALLKRLDALPSRMAEAFGKPESIQDVFAALSAIAALVECCETSFASDEAGVAFWAMATWLNRISERFNQMVAAHCPAALVVVAHWAALLVMRAEHCGCWFLRGSMRRVLLLVAERLRIEDCAVQSLVGGLMV